VDDVHQVRVREIQRRGKESRIHFPSLAVSLIQHTLLFQAKRSRFTSLSELLQFLRSSIGKVDVPVIRRMCSAKRPLVLRVRGSPRPGSIIVLGELVKDSPNPVSRSEQETGFGKFERSAYVGRLVDNRLPQ
jgi:hypothetical protein